MKSFETQKHLHPIKGEGKQEKKKLWQPKLRPCSVQQFGIKAFAATTNTKSKTKEEALRYSLISPIYLTATISSPSWISFPPTWELLISPSQLRRKVLQYNFSKKHGIRKEEINKLRISGRLIQWNSNNFFFSFLETATFAKNHFIDLNFPIMSSHISNEALTNLTGVLPFQWERDSMV